MTYNKAVRVLACVCMCACFCVRLLVTKSANFAQKSSRALKFGTRMARRLSHMSAKPEHSGAHVRQVTRR